MDRSVFSLKIGRWRCAAVLAVMVPALGLLPGVARVKAQAVEAAPGTGVPVLDATRVEDARLDLGGGWLVHAGDDPAYAEAGFDDSQWTRINVAKDSLHDLFRTRPQVLWYRLHIKVKPGVADLALRVFDLSPAYVIYTNGVPLIQVGRVAPLAQYDNHGRLRATIPADQTVTGSFVLAIRMYVSPVQWAGAFPGVNAWMLSLGEGWSLRENTWLQVIGENAVEALSDFILLCLGLGALVLYSAQRKQEYLWLALVGAVGLLPVPVTLYAQMHTFPVNWHIFDAIHDFIFVYLTARMYLAFADWPLGWRLHAYLVFSSVANGLASVLFWDGLVNLSVYPMLRLPAVLLMTLVLPIVLTMQFRRGRREVGILMVPLLLSGLYYDVFYLAFSTAQIPRYRVHAWEVFTFLLRAQIGPFAFSLFSILEILAWVTLALIILLRINRTSRQQALLEVEMANARAVQQVLLPEHTEAVPGFEIESVYEPAQEVGGDFFQVLPAGEGGLLLVVGDVAGKGLPAAMLVSMLVGAFRTAAAYGCAPAEVLAQLNERLIGRASGGFSTALAAHIAADGRLTMANAGHLPPYLDGREIELPGALPLGIDKSARYETARLDLKPGSRLTFYSDGVIEAQNPAGELFGFERGKELSTKPAADIAAEARQFGQVDDITVVAIRRTAALVSAVAG